MQTNTSQNNNDQYAEQWIAFLRRRNTILNVVWPVLLILVAMSGLSAIYYYQLHLVSQQELKNVEIDLAYAKSEYSYLQADFDAMRDDNDKLSTELDGLKSDQRSLSEKQSDSANQLDQSHKEVTSLKQEVELLQTEKNGLSDNVLEAKALLIQQKRLNEAKMTAKQQSSNKVTSTLNKQISARKIAYLALVKRQHEMQGDMERLENVAAIKEAELKLIKSSRNTAKQGLLLYKQKLDALNEKYLAAEKKLQLVMSPIGAEAKSQTRSVKKTNIPVNSKTMTDGLEEIKQPVVVKSREVRSKEVKPREAKSSNAVFDYDKININ